MMSHVATFSTKDVSTFAWSRLGNFENIEFTAARMAEEHAAPAKQMPNVRRQAAQLKYCLAQAKEYAEAAGAVSQATKPVLLYYCAMSLALCEILFKQDGRFRLEKLREQHNCHGLTFALESAPTTSDSLAITSKLLLARPQLGPNGKAKGTFEVWRQGAGEYPLIGRHIDKGELREITAPRMLYGPDRTQHGDIGDRITLFDCFRNLPAMADLLGRLGVVIDMAKVTASCETKPNEPAKYQLIFQAINVERMQRLAEQLQCRASAVNDLKILDLGNSMIVEHDQHSGLHMPPATALSTSLTFMSSSRTALNEFGYLYCALHIAGNFARYFPDIWLKHVEMVSPLAQAVAELCTVSLDRLPLHTLSELSGYYHVEQA